MSNFGAYAQYYDTLYQEKDYEAECDFLEQIFQAYGSGPVRRILDLGCGTGGHAIPLARRGYAVVGVDRSESMLRIARSKTAKMGLSIDFRQGDIRDVNLDQTFDTVIAMFAVVSYQITNADLTAAFRTARRHLRPGGLFVFDAWFGPTVLTQRPTDRYKIIESGNERIIRFVHAELDAVAQTVMVNYKVLHLKEGQVIDEVDETHPMRFLFAQEIAYFLETNGFELLKLCPFMALDRGLNEQDWNVTTIARAV